MMEKKPAHECQLLVLYRCIHVCIIHALHMRVHACTIMCGCEEEVHSLNGCTRCIRRWSVSAIRPAAASTSDSVVWRPTERRSVPRANSGGTATALRTEETDTSPAQTNSRAMSFTQITVKRTELRADRIIACGGRTKENHGPL